MPIKSPTHLAYMDSMTCPYFHIWTLKAFRFKGLQDTPTNSPFHFSIYQPNNIQIPIYGFYGMVMFLYMGLKDPPIFLFDLHIWTHSHSHLYPSRHAR